MGGSIRIVTKLNNELHTHTRWTNALPEYVMSDKFIEKDEKYIKKYLENYKTSQYKLDIELFSPCDYGLDVFDFDKKVILSNQGYCAYDMIETVSISLSLRYTNFTDRNEEILKTKRMYDKKQLSLVKGYDEQSVVEQPETYEKAWKLMDDSGEVINFKVNWEDFGWKYIRFEESEKGFIEMLDYCVKNYKLTLEDIKDWVTFIKDRYEDESETNFKDLENKYINYYRENKLKRIV